MSDLQPLPPRQRSGAREAVRQFFRRWIRPFFARRLSRLSAVLVPPLYLAYMRFVWATSRVEPHDYCRLKDVIKEYNGAVGLLWHEEVLTVAYGYYYLRFRPHTLASLGESGEVITRMLERCGFVVFRGGTTTHRSRRREGTLQEMIDHMRVTDEVIYGITVDGSKGPPYRMKTGGIIIARECGKPLALSRTWYRHCIRLRTWDRMALPLPFNVIGYYLKGPYFVPADASTPEGLEAFRLRLENDLIDLAVHSYEDLGRRPPANLVKRQPGEADVGV
jgi:hypothetical protein